MHQTIRTVGHELFSIFFLQSSWPSNPSSFYTTALCTAHTSSRSQVPHLSGVALGDFLRQAHTPAAPAVTPAAATPAKGEIFVATRPAWLIVP